MFLVMVKVAGAVLAVVVAVVLPVAAAVASSSPSPQSEDAFVSYIAQERDGAGLPAYSEQGDLTAVARKHAEDMADAGRIYHNPNLQSDVKNWDSVGENVGKGASVESIHRAFMESASHRSEILSTKFTQVGVGVVERDGTLWVSQVFRKPSAPKPATTQPPPATTTTAAASAASQPSTTPPRSATTQPSRSASAGALTTSSTARPTSTTTTTTEPVPSTTAAPTTAVPGGDGSEIATAPPRLDLPTPGRDVTVPIGVAAALLVAVVAALTGQVATASDHRK